MKIIANDGREGFKSVEECLEYEQKLLKKKEEYNREKNTRFEAIEKKQKELLDLISGFESDYGEYIEVPVDLFSNAIGRMFGFS